MADVKTVNIVDDQAEDFYDADQTAERGRKVEGLEREKLQLERENKETKDKIKELTTEIEKLKSSEKEMRERLREMELEIEKNDEGKNVLESVANRAMELETEVSRLQHDLIAAMTEGEAVNNEVTELKRVLGEKGGKIDLLEKELESLKTAKAESEKRVRELERKIGVLEVKETEEKSKKIRMEEEMRERLDEKESELSLFKKKVEDLESVVARNVVDLEKRVKEKLSVEVALGESEDKYRAMELKLLQLQKEVVEAEKVINGLKERTVGAINGIVNETKEILEGGEMGSKGLSMPVLAGSTGAIVAVAAAAVYLLYLRPR